MTFWTARETNIHAEETCLWSAHFFSLSDTLSNCVWWTDPDLAPVFGDQWDYALSPAKSLVVLFVEGLD